MMHYLLILLIGYLLGCSNMAVYLAAAQNVDPACTLSDRRTGL